MGKSLFEIQTNQIHLTWGQIQERASPLNLPTATALPYSLHVHSHTSDYRLSITPSSRPRLFEQTDYTLLLKSVNKQHVQLLHVDPTLCGALHYNESHTIGHGVLNFGSQIGRSRFVIEVGGQPHLTFEIEVFPSKIDYQTDYLALCDDLETIQRGLLASYLQATYQQGRSVPESGDSTLSWLAILTSVVDDLATALRFIREHPHWRIQRQPTRTKAAQITRITPATRHDLLTGHGGHPLTVLNALDVRLPTDKALYTLDTPEHRWLAFHLQYAVFRLQRIRDTWPMHKATPRQIRLYERLGTLRDRIRILLKKPPFHAFEHQRNRPAPSLTLQRAPGYREAYQACLALRNGLSFASGSILFSIKDLHLLYEYWCFITLLRLLADLCGDETPLARLLITHQYGLELHLRKGQKQTFIFSGKQEKRIVCTYNPRFSGQGYLVPQQPDFALAVSSPSQPPRRYILDAKYRLDQSTSYERRFGMPGPPTDALNTLHRYRDAILGEESAVDRDRRTVLQAVALFPYRETTPGTFAQSQLNKALQNVGVGAIPLLPNATQHLKEWLETLLDA